MIDELSSMVSEYQIEGDNMRVVEIPMTTEFTGSQYETEMNYLKEHYRDAVSIKFNNNEDVDGTSVVYYVSNWLFSKYESGNIKSFWVTLIDQFGDVKTFKLTYTSSSDTYTWDNSSMSNFKNGTLQFYFLE